MYLDRPHGRIELTTLSAKDILGEITLIDGGMRITRSSLAVHCLASIRVIRFLGVTFGGLQVNQRFPSRYVGGRDTNQLIQEQWV